MERPTRAALLTVRGRIHVLRAAPALVRPAVLVTERRAAPVAPHLPRHRRITHGKLAALGALPRGLVLARKQKPCVPAPRSDPREIQPTPGASASGGGRGGRNQRPGWESRARTVLTGKRNSPSLNTPHAAQTPKIYQHDLRCDRFLVYTQQHTTSSGPESGCVLSLNFFPNHAAFFSFTRQTKYASTGAQPLNIYKPYNPDPTPDEARDPTRKEL